MQNVAFKFNVDRGTVSEYAFVREAIAEYISNNYEKFGGFNPDGTNKVVEIDKSSFFKEKYSRCRLTDCQWYIEALKGDLKSLNKICTK